MRRARILIARGGRSAIIREFCRSICNELTCPRVPRDGRADRDRARSSLRSRSRSWHRADFLSTLSGREWPTWNARASCSSQAGSHMMLGVMPCYAWSSPDHKQVRPGTLRRIIADAGLTPRRVLGVRGRVASARRRHMLTYGSRRASLDEPRRPRPRPLRQPARHPRHAGGDGGVRRQRHADEDRRRRICRPARRSSCADCSRPALGLHLDRRQRLRWRELPHALSPDRAVARASPISAAPSPSSPRWCTCRWPTSSASCSSCRWR